MTLQEFTPTCPDSSFSYIIPSPVQCDLYYLCELGRASRRWFERFFSITVVWNVLSRYELHAVLSPIRIPGFLSLE